MEEESGHFPTQSTVGVATEFFQEENSKFDLIYTLGLKKESLLSLKHV